MSYGIVAFQDQDHDRLVDIWYKAVVYTHTFLTVKDIEFYHDMVRNGALKEVEIWQEVNENAEPIGFIGLDGTKIEMLFVDPKYHGKGIGSRLIHHAVEIKGRNLQVDVNEQNDGAYAFYKKLGFVQVGRSELDNSGQPFPLLHLELISGGSKMDIRKFTDTDINQIVSLFYETVHSVNKRDYTQEQLDAWAPKDEESIKLNTWKDSLSRNVTYVAELNGIIVGFSDMTPYGHLDRLFVHKDFQGQGIASALVHKLETEARGRGLKEMDTEASITARPFFERQGFRVVQSQEVERKGVKLVNFKMVKNLLL